MRVLRQRVGLTEHGRKNKEVEARMNAFRKKTTQTTRGEGDKNYPRRELNPNRTRSSENPKKQNENTLSFNGTFFLKHHATPQPDLREKPALFTRQTEARTRYICATGWRFT